MTDPYTYPGTDVLVNRFGLKDARELEYRERWITAARIAKRLPSLTLSPRGMARIHAHIFGDVYPWAGEFRKCDLAKGNSFFCRPQHIERELTIRFNRIVRDRGLSSRHIPEFAHSCAHHFSELNAIHPFREGNGRTMRKLVYEIAERNGMRLRLNSIDREQWIDASIRAFDKGDTTRLQAIFEGNIELDMKLRQRNHRRERRMRDGLER